MHNLQAFLNIFAIIEDIGVLHVDLGCLASAINLLVSCCHVLLHHISGMDLYAFLSKQFTLFLSVLVALCSRCSHLSCPSLLFLHDLLEWVFLPDLGLFLLLRILSFARNYF